MKKALVVEDDIRVREIMAMTLSRAGFDVTAVETAEEAFTTLEGMDVLVLDLKLTKMPGEDFLRMIRKDGNYVPVIVVSGAYSKEEVDKRLKGLDIIDFVPKPFSIHELLEKVAKAVQISDNMGSIKRSTDFVKSFIERRARV